MKPETDELIEERQRKLSFSKADLLRRGWTRTSIAQILGTPDGYIPRGRKDRREHMCYAHRVIAAEKGIPAAAEGLPHIARAAGSPGLRLQRPSGTREAELLRRSPEVSLLRLSKLTQAA
jgi:hypothetical protein